MQEQQRHQMVLETTHSSGAEEWNCPACGRRLLISWEPSFKKIVLEAGDEFSFHGGSKGILNIGGLQISPISDYGPQSATEPPPDDPHLAPWARWLDKKDWGDF